MGRKLDTLMEYSENLTKGFSPASKWIVKHLPVILLVLAMIPFLSFVRQTIRRNGNNYGKNMKKKTKDNLKKT